VDFAFRLTTEEKPELVTICDRFYRLKHSAATPLAFSEHGVIMAGLSQKEVAHRLQIAYQSYQAWENLKVANPTLKQLSKLACAVGKKLIIDMV
jgi:DNA-binding XRE family transcriptional regulator